MEINTRQYDLPEEIVFDTEFGSENEINLKCIELSPRGKVLIMWTNKAGPGSEFLHCGTRVLNISTNWEAALFQFQQTCSELISETEERLQVCTQRLL